MKMLHRGESVFRLRCVYLRFAINWARGHAYLRMGLRPVFGDGL
jgi:hypothetical protein